MGLWLKLDSNLRLVWGLCLTEGLDLDLSTDLGL